MKGRLKTILVLMLIIPMLISLSIPIISLLPSNATTEDNLICSAEIEGYENESFNSIFQWFSNEKLLKQEEISYKFNNNSTQIFNSTLFSSETQKGDVFCELDIIQNNITNTYEKSTTIFNSPPFFINPLQDFSIYENETFNYNIICSDLDNDIIYYYDNSTHWDINNQTGEIFWENPLIGNFYYEIICSDLEENTSDLFTLQVLEVETIPTEIDELDEIIPEVDENEDLNETELNETIEMNETDLNVSLMCEDRTLIDTCSITKPLYCLLNQELAPVCSICGCEEGFDCTILGECKEQEILINDDIFVSIKLSNGEKIDKSFGQETASQARLLNKRKGLERKEEISEDFKFITGRNHLNNEKILYIQPLQNQDVESATIYIKKSDPNQLILSVLYCSDENFNEETLECSLWEHSDIPFIQDNEYVIFNVSHFSSYTISACGNLNEADAVYNLTANISTIGSCFYVTATNVTLDCKGYSIIGDNDTGDIAITTSKDFFTLVDCDIRNFGTGVRITRDNVTITNSNFTFNNIGINAISSSGHEFSSNNLFYNTYGINLDFTTDSHLNQNIIQNNEYGIYLTLNSINNDISLNDIENNGKYAVMVDLSSCDNELTDNTAGAGEAIGYYHDSTSLSIADEIFSQLLICNVNESNFHNITIDNTGVESDGLVMINSHDNNFTDSRISNSYYGIYLNTATSNNFSAVNFTSNLYYGLYAESTATGNVFPSTRFCDNYLHDPGPNQWYYDIWDLDNNDYAGAWCDLANISGTPSGCDNTCNYEGCVDLDNAATYQGKIRRIGNYFIIEDEGADITLCNKSYTVNVGAAEGAITIAANNVTLNCNGSTFDGIDSDGYGIYMNVRTNNTVSNCLVTRYQYGFYIQGASQLNRIEGNTATVCVSGLMSQVGASNNTIINNVFTYNTWHGIHTYQFNYNDVINNTIAYNTQYGIYAEGASSFRSIYNHYINNTIRNNGIHGIYFAGYINFNTIEGNTIYSNTQHGIYLYNYVDSNTIRGNTIYSNTQNGIYTYRASSNSILNNTIYSNNHNGIYIYYYSTLNTISSNTVYSNTQQGIYVYSGTITNTITNNTVYSNTQNGIYLSSSNTNTISNNRVYDNTRNGLYIISSTNPRIENNQLYNNTWWSVSLDATSIPIGFENNTGGINNLPICSIISQSGGAQILNTNSCAQVIVANSNNVDIINVTVNNGAKKSDGFLFLNTNNIYVINSTANNTYGGFTFLGTGTSSHNNTITGCKSLNNVLNGFYFETSYDNNILENEAYNNANNGIYLYWNSNSNNISKNTLYSNTQSGVYLRGTTTSNTITENVIYSNTQYGIYLYDSANSNILTNNTIYSNTLSGVYLVAVQLNVLSRNVIHSNIQHGVFIYYGGTNSLINNTISTNILSGVKVDYSPSNIITNNSIFSNIQNGIDLYGSTATLNTISENTIYSNGYNGIYTVSTPSNNFQHNTVYSNIRNGFYLYSSTNSNTLTNNTAHSNTLSGILIRASTTNVLTNNTASNNTLYGIYLDNGDTNTFSDNRISQNTLYGIYALATSTGNIFNNDYVCFNQETAGPSYFDIYDLDTNTYNQVWCDTSDRAGSDICYLRCTYNGEFILPIAGTEFDLNDTIYIEFNETMGETTINNVTFHLPGGAPLCQGTNNTAGNGENYWGCNYSIPDNITQNGVLNLEARLRLDGTQIGQVYYSIKIRPFLGNTVHPTAVGSSEIVNVTPVKVIDGDNTSLIFVCTQDGTNPTQSNYECTNTPTYTTNYSELYCALQAPTYSATMTVKCKLFDADVYSRLIQSTYESDNSAPVLTIVSVAEDLSAPYYDRINDGTTLIQLSSNENVTGCKYAETDLGYDDALELCTVSGTNVNCTFSTPTQFTSKTLYISCIDNAGNKNTAANNKHVIFGADWIAPTSSINITAQAIDEYVIPTYILQLTETDNLYGPAGIATYYCVQKDSNCTVTHNAGSLIDNGELISLGNTMRGPVYLNYHSIDTPGNQQNVSYLLRINRLPVFTSITRSPSSAGVGGNSPINFTTVSSDQDAQNMTLIICNISNKNLCKANPTYQLCNSTGEENLACTYTTPAEDVTINWYVFLYDEYNEFSSLDFSGSFNVISTPPQISIFSPSPMTYTTVNISIRVNLDRAPQSVFYCLNNISGSAPCSSNITLTQNTPLNWRGELTNLNDQVGGYNYSLVIYANDTYGNVDTATVNFSIDSTYDDLTPPEVSVTAPSSGSYHNSLNVPIEVSVNEPCDIVEYYYAGSYYNLTRISTYEWNGTLNLAQGVHNINIYANDSSVNKNRGSTSVNLIIDTTPPNLVDNYTMPNITIDNQSIACVFEWADTYLNHSIIYSNLNGSVVTQTKTFTAGKVNYTISDVAQITPGIFYCNSTAFDLAGNNNTVSMIITVEDVTPPVIHNYSYNPSDEADLDPPSQVVTFTFNVTDKGTITDYYLVYWKGALNYTTNLIQTGSIYNKSITLDEGNWTVVAYFNDTADNSATQIMNIPIFYDTTLEIDDTNLPQENFIIFMDERASANELGQVNFTNTGDLNFTLTITTSWINVWANETNFNLSTTQENTTSFFADTTTLGVGETPVNLIFTYTNEDNETFTQTISRTLIIIPTNGSYLHLEMRSYPSTLVPGGEPGRFVARAVNWGRDTAENVTLNWTLPDSWTITSGTNPLIVGELINGHSADSSITVSVPLGQEGTKTVTVFANSLDSNDTESVNVTMVTEFGEIIEETPPIKPPPGGSGTPGGGSSGSSSGGKVIIKQPDTTVQISEEELERLFNTEAFYELVRGEDKYFLLTIENPFDDVTLEDVNVEITGLLSKYLSATPTYFDKIGVNQSETVRINIVAPTYFTKGTHKLIIYITGTAVRETNDTIIYMNMNEKREVTLEIHELSKEEVEILVEQAEIHVQDMLSNGFNTEKVNRYLENAKNLIQARDYEGARDEVEKIFSDYKYSFQVYTEMKNLKRDIDSALEREISIDNTQRLYNLAMLAAQRGDFATALDRLNEAKLTYALETKGEFNILFFIKTNSKELAISMIAISVVLFIAFMQLRWSAIIKQLKVFNHEKEVVLGLMKVVQEDTFKNKKMSMREYEQAILQYEKRLGKIVQGIIETETKKSQMEHLAKMQFMTEKTRLTNERDRLIVLIKELQENYMVEQKIDTRVYMNMMHAYSERVGDIEERLALLDAESVLQKQRSIVTKIFNRGVKR